MKTTIKRNVDVELKELRVVANPRYWEDSEVNGVEDTEGTLIPCRVGDGWCPIIDLDTGVITNWTKGVTAEIHYKVCDDGAYSLVDADGECVLLIEGYVPSIMCPGRNGYGDYIIMDVDSDGQISDWEADISDFQSE